MNVPLPPFLRSSVFRQTLLVLITAGFLFTAGGFVSPRANLLPLFVPSSKGEERVINRSAPLSIKNEDIDFALFWNVWDFIQRKSIHRPLSERALFYGALRGMVEAVEDPYTSFFDPETAKKFSDDIQGSFDGIGAEIGVRARQLVIVAPLPDTPASNAGLKAGDAILSIDGVESRILTLEEAVRKIRGPKGSIVKLLIAREGWGTPKEIPLTRSTITIVSVRWKILEKGAFPKDIGYRRIAFVTLAGFDAQSIGRFRRVVMEVVAQNPVGLIVDVRNNPGGLLEAAIDITGEWVEKNLVVTEQWGKDGNSRKVEHRSQSRARLSGIPTVVLINQGSASASEILAGALQDHGKATLVGTKTFGKGSVQELNNLPDGSAVKITIAQWLTPHGRNIDRNGIEPNVKVEITEEDEKAGKDPQLERAIRELVKKVR